MSVSTQIKEYERLSETFDSSSSRMMNVREYSHFYATKHCVAGPSDHTV